jgi:hypothetical protein
MENQTTPTITPPGLVPSMVSGFNAVTSNVSLILFPVVIDVLFWFGPHIRLEKLLNPAIDQFITAVGELNRPDMQEMAITSANLWKEYLQHFNLFTILSTFPIGIPSLVKGILPIDTPIGTAPVAELTSTAVAGLLWGFFIILGLVLGSAYISLIAKCVNPTNVTYSIQNIFREALQVILLTVTLLLILVLVSIPIIFMTAVIAIVSPGIAEIALFLAGLVALWFLLPLVFSPHGIFMFKMNAFVAMITSARFVRALLPGASLFIMTVVIVMQGMNVIWTVPPEQSWMLMVGIFGHAFISTGLIASSFVFYQRGIIYIQSILNTGIPTPSQG